MRARDAAQGEGTFADAADGLGELPGASLIRRQSTARSLAADAMWRELRKASELQKEMELATVDPALVNRLARKHGNIARLEFAAVEHLT